MELLRRPRTGRCRGRRRRQSPHPRRRPRRPATAAPRAGGRGEVADLSDRELPLVEHGAHHTTDLAGGTHDSNSHGRRHGRRGYRWIGDGSRRFPSGHVGDEPPVGTIDPVEALRDRRPPRRQPSAPPWPIAVLDEAHVVQRRAVAGEMGENRPWPEAVRLPSETGQRPRAQSRGTGKTRHRPDHGSGRHEGEILDDPRAEVQRDAPAGLHARRVLVSDSAPSREQCWNVRYEKATSALLSGNGRAPSATCGRQLSRSSEAVDRLLAPGEEAASTSQGDDGAEALREGRRHAADAAADLDQRALAVVVVEQPERLPVGDRLDPTGPDELVQRLIQLVVEDPADGASRVGGGRAGSPRRRCATARARSRAGHVRSGSGAL